MSSAPPQFTQTVPLHSDGNQCPLFAVLTCTNSATLCRSGLRREAFWPAVGDGALKLHNQTDPSSIQRSGYWPALTSSCSVGRFSLCRGSSCLIRYTCGFSFASANLGVDWSKHMPRPNL